jgi:transcriptional regulator with XRE-family HTH domain
LGLFQWQVAERLGASIETYLLWEKGRGQPLTRYYPAIFRFLGYDPYPEPRSLPEQIASKRRRLGWSIKEAAARLKVDEGTFGRWESGAWEPRLSRKTIKRFLGMKTPPLGQGNKRR